MLCNQQGTMKGRRDVFDRRRRWCVIGKEQDRLLIEVFVRRKGGRGQRALLSSNAMAILSWESEFESESGKRILNHSTPRKVTLGARAD